MVNESRTMKIVISLGAALVLAAGLWEAADAGVGAAPMPPRMAVNHAERQCAMFVTGDECGDAILPEGWEYLSPDDLSCPDGYSVVDLRPEWQHFKAPFCCTEGHSGVAGDCQDVVMNPLKRQCAFVEDIEACGGLPLGWVAWGKDCPSLFTWTEEVACKGAANDPSPTPGALPFTAPAMTPTPATPQPAQGEPTARNPLLPCAPVGMALVVATGRWGRRGR